MRRLFLIFCLINIISCSSIERTGEDKDKGKIIKQYLNEAMGYFQEDKLYQAMKIWEKILRLDPGNKVVRQYLRNTQKKANEKIKDAHKRAEDAYNNDKWDKAIEIFENILKLSPEDNRAAERLSQIKQKLNEHYGLGLLAKKKGDYVKAVNEWQKVAEKYRNFYNVEDLIKEAREKIKGKEKEEQLINSYYKEARRLYKARDEEKSVSKLHQLLSLSPKHQKALKMLSRIAASHYKSGRKYFNNNQFIKAIEEWNKVISIDPTNKDVRVMIVKARKEYENKINKNYLSGVDKYNRGEYLEAIKQWKKALKYNPKHEEMRVYVVKAMLAQGIIYYRLDKLNKAIGAWSEVLKIDSKNKKGRLYLSRAVKKKKRLEEL